MAELGDIALFSQDVFTAIALVFARVAAAVGLMPGFGSSLLPMRVRLAVSVAFTMIVWPMVPDAYGVPLLPALIVEIAVGITLGLSIRMLVMALQFAGSIAAQSTSLAQLLGPGAMPDPMPAIGAMLSLAGVTLALILGLHIRIAEALVLSYDLFPPGRLPNSGELAQWGIARTGHTISLGFTLAAPFVVVALAYNIALGAINRAMPQLMVAFIGAPAITGASIILMLLAAPAILILWNELLADLLAAPFSSPP
ncbi:flagellar biosynthetic protein FliR [Monaibacterium marinum]|uniref:Flagellar biosynthetic protein FliR n=1 Tax=Pontivivens marinum TaxID=1690039 RepID=A0A2C9CUA8_9RHOB|nr:flagellar biosynthetic protein FliR [Monaibacterium marinum]SOH95101.1 flagellar biosynthetic protein FliR [Monaibacterium marinum]